MQAPSGSVAMNDHQSVEGGSVEQTRGQRQTGCNDLPGRVREVA